MGSRKPGIKNCELGKEGFNLVLETERMSTFWDIKFKFISNTTYDDIRKYYVFRIFYS